MTTMTTIELATQFDTTPRDLRKFLRSDASGIAGVGKGSRYALPGSKREVAAMRKRYDAWKVAQVSTKKVESIPVDVPETDDEVEAILDAQGPTLDELDAIETELDD